MVVSRKKIAVIGAGVAGLLCTASLKEEEHEPICFEKTDSIGGTFCYRERSIEGMGSVMPTTVLNNNKEMGAFSNFPPPKEFSVYLRHDEFLQYVMQYYIQFNCQQYVRFNKEVIYVKKNDDYDETGRFSVTVQDTVSGKVSTEVFDGVLVATGHFNLPKYVTFPGQQNFKGTLMHTHSLKGVEKFRGKNVLVIGSGCSAFDAAVEVSSVAKSVYVSNRSGSHIVNRVGPFGYPIDYVVLRRFAAELLDILSRDAASWILEKLFLDTKFHNGLYPVKPIYHVLCKDPVINDVIISKILSGAVVMKGNVKNFAENGVVFCGEEKITNIDDIIMATGYTFDFPFLDKNLLKIENGRIDLYKCVFPAHLPHASLAFIGFVNPFGPGAPVVEIQTRWAAQIFSGKRELPSQETMMKEILKRHERNKREMAPSEFNSIQVHFFQYIQDIASEIGAKPNIIKFLFSDFPLFLKLVFGPLVPYHWRLQGPHKWEGARNCIMTCRERLLYPLKTDKKPDKSYLQILWSKLYNYIPKRMLF